eukprot:Skav232192  [mRNA]  locus=scaffold4523:84556:85669:+ [translate_table: standard]
MPRSWASSHPSQSESGEVMPCVANLESLVEEVQLAPLEQGVLLVNVAPQFGGVLHVGIWNDEGIAFLGTIALRRLEDLQEDLLVLRLQLIVFACAQTLQESSAQSDLGLQRAWSSTARGHAAEAIRFAEVKLVQVQVHTLRHLGPLTQLEALRHEHWSSRLTQLHSSLPLQGMALSELKAIQAKLHTSINRLQVLLPTCEHVDETAVLQLDAGVATHVPKLWDLWMRLFGSRLHDLICDTVPLRIHSHMRIHQVLGHDRSLCQLTKVENHTLALSDEVKVSAEGICELLQRMSGSSHRARELPRPS